MSTNKQANRLIHEKSPYLLQHAHNPVDWFPWGEEAFQKAAMESKPIFLSIGYSTCHWCHVMERESFEDNEVASVLNENFVSVKVDREERPDIDHIYMSVCQAITGHGGWPLTVFLTPDRKPFYAGTYFPKDNRQGMLGLISLLNRITEAWEDNRDALLESGDKLVALFNEPATSFQEELDKSILDEAFNDFASQFDRLYGGFGQAPKFPTPHNLLFLLRYWHTTHEKQALEIVEKTLESMYRGGIYDHIGFGFSRYSTDRKWLVPHFEKMLYDNALLSIAYLETYHVTKNEKYANIARRIFEYVTRDMLSPEGAFYSAEDADSEGIEGKFYVWTTAQIKKVLGEKDGDRFSLVYDITEKGNFEGYNIPNLIKGSLPDSDLEFMESCRKRLFEERKKRIHPFKDKKLLTSWNGLMIAALAIGGRILREEVYVQTADRAAAFILSNLLRDDGRLQSRYKDGDTSVTGFIDDYAFMVWGLIELYETTYKPSFLKKAIELNSSMLELFWDHEKGGLFINGSDSEQLIARPKEIYDGASPSGNSVASLNLLRLARFTGNHELEDKAKIILKTFWKNISNYPQGHSFSLISLMFTFSTSKEIIVVEGQDTNKTKQMLDIIKEKFSPFAVSLYYSDENSALKTIAPYISNYIAVNNQPSAYVCKNYTCSYPVTDTGHLRELLL